MVVRRLTLNHFPSMQFHLDWHPYTEGAIRWAKGYKEDADGHWINWPRVQEDRWRPYYWFIWIRVWLHGSATLKRIDVLSGKPFVVTFASSEATDAQGI